MAHPLQDPKLAEGKTPGVRDETSRPSARKGGAKGAERQRPPAGQGRKHNVGGEEGGDQERPARPFLVPWDRLTGARKLLFPPEAITCPGHRVAIGEVARRSGGAKSRWVYTDGTLEAFVCSCFLGALPPPEEVKKDANGDHVSNWTMHRLVPNADPRAQFTVNELRLFVRLRLAKGGANPLSVPSLAVHVPPSDATTPQRGSLGPAPASPSDAPTRSPAPPAPYPAGPIPPPPSPLTVRISPPRPLQTVHDSWQGVPAGSPLSPLSPSLSPLSDAASAVSWHSDLDEPPPVRARVERPVAAPPAPRIWTKAAVVTTRLSCRFVPRRNWVFETDRREFEADLFAERVRRPASGVGYYSQLPKDGVADEEAPRATWSAPLGGRYQELLREISARLPVTHDIIDYSVGDTCVFESLCALAGKHLPVPPRNDLSLDDVLVYADALGLGVTDIVRVAPILDPNRLGMHAVGIRTRVLERVDVRKFLLMFNYMGSTHVCVAVPSRLTAALSPFRNFWTTVARCRDLISVQLPRGAVRLTAMTVAPVLLGVACVGWRGALHYRGANCVRIACTSVEYRPTGALSSTYSWQTYLGMAVTVGLYRYIISRDLMQVYDIASVMWAAVSAYMCGTIDKVTSHGIQLRRHFSACTSGKTLAPVSETTCVCDHQAYQETALVVGLNGLAPGGENVPLVQEALDSVHPSPGGGEAGLRAAVSVATSVFTSRGKMVTHQLHLAMRQLFCRRLQHEVAIERWASATFITHVDMLPTQAFNVFDDAEPAVLVAPSFMGHFGAQFTRRALTKYPWQWPGFFIKTCLGNLFKMARSAIEPGVVFPDCLRPSLAYQSAVGPYAYRPFARGFTREEAEGAVCRYISTNEMYFPEAHELGAVGPVVLADGDGDPEVFFMNNRRDKQRAKIAAAATLPKVPVTCPCGQPAARSAAHCKTCLGKGKCGRLRGGVVCGYPLAYGDCALCRVPECVAAIEGGAPSAPVVSEPQGTAFIRLQPISFLKGQGCKTEIGTEERPLTKVVEKRVRRKPYTSIHGPVIGVLGPSPPMFCAKDHASKLATVHARMCPVMPAGHEVDQDGPWTAFESWVKTNFDYLFTNPTTGAKFEAADPITNLRTQAARRAMGWWCNRFSGDKRAKKWDALRLFRRRGLLPEDLKLTSMLKSELSQAPTKRLNDSPALVPGRIDSDGYKTPNSSLACSRVLRYYTTNVVDVVCGPFCEEAARVLKTKVWTGDHVLRYGAGRTSEQVGSWFQRFHEGMDSFIGRDFTLYDNSHGVRSHALFFYVLWRGRFFLAPEHREIFDKVFPAHITFDQFCIILEHGLASGAVWTTLLNTILNALVSLYTTHQAFQQSFGPTTLAAFCQYTRYRGTYAGDDSAVMGRGLVGLEPRALQVAKPLGFVIKSKCEDSVFRLAFLGATPAPCAKRVSGSWVEVWTMVSLPHRHLCTLGVMQVAPPNPFQHLAGVAFAWSRAQGHVPPYGALYRAIMERGGMTVRGPLNETPFVKGPLSAGAERAVEEAAKWAEYCTTVAAVDGCQYRATASTLVAVCLAWEVSPDIVAVAEQQLRSTPVPGNICTPEVLALCTGSARR